MKVVISRIREFLFPGPTEQDERLWQEILRASHGALHALGGLEMAAAVLLLPRPVQLIALAALGLATLLLARGQWSKRYGRTLALISAAFAMGLIGWAGGDAIHTAGMVIPIGLVMAVPLLPVHVVVLGAATELLYIRLAPGNDLFVFTMTALGAGIAAVLHQRRCAAHRERQEALRVAEALSGAQLRAQLAESAVAIGKLAAAVTHEINTPLGSLASAVDTLLVVAARQCNASPEQQQRLVTLQADLRRSVQISTDRIRGVIARLQRFIGLEEADLRQANLNELISDVAILFQEQVQHGVQLEFDFQPVPSLMCRPQLLSVVFSSLLSNAINAVNGDPHIVVSTRRDGTNVEVAIQDNGRGMSPEQIENIFDPGFKVSGTRISSGNWSLFNSRQIIFEHGGDIRISSTEGKGTTVWVTLPAA